MPPYLAAESIPITAAQRRRKWPRLFFHSGPGVKLSVNILAGSYCGMGGASSASSDVPKGWITPRYRAGDSGVSPGRAETIT